MRPTLVFRTVWSVEIFSRLAIFACLLFVESIAASAAPGVLPRRCKGMRDQDLTLYSLSLGHRVSLTLMVMTAHERRNLSPLLDI